MSPALHGHMEVQLEFPTSDLERERSCLGYRVESTLALAAVGMQNLPGDFFGNTE